MNTYVSKEAFLDFMENWAPKRLAEPWDNVGLLIDMGATSYRKILVALDFCQATVEEAICQKADLIVTHHPILMTAIRSLSVFDVEQQLMMTCIQHGISHFAAHTNLDSSEKGINVCLANTLGLVDHRSILLKPEILSQGIVDDSVGLMRMGQLPHAMKGDEFCLWIKDKLQIPFVRVAGPMKRPVRQVAVSCGSGFSETHHAMMQGADALVAGELKHHTALHANEEGILLVDAGHFETERIICPYLIEGLQEQFDGVKYKTEFLLHDPKIGPIRIIE